MQPLTDYQVCISPGHTSPSFEDDDFTDGRDSLSQVSTSEQSENEDIRNFENYVVEYNQQKEQPSASPLHCPFPALQQNELIPGPKKPETALAQAPALAPGLTPLADVKISGQDGRMSRLDFGVTSLDQAHESSRKHTHTSANPPSGPGPAARPPATPVRVNFPLPAGISRGKDSQEFADFKMATVPSPAATDVAPPGDVSLIGDEDKYSALRVLSSDSDIPAASLFEGQSQVSEGSGKDGANNQDVGVVADVTQEDTDWADFSSGPSPSAAGANLQQTLPSGERLFMFIDPGQLIVSHHSEICSSINYTVGKTQHEASGHQKTYPILHYSLFIVTLRCLCSLGPIVQL